MKLTIEQIERLWDDLNGKPDIFYSEIDTLKRWADSNGANLKQKLYRAIIVAFRLGVKRGRAYERREQKKRFTLTLDERKQAEAIADTWTHDNEMSKIMTVWDAESVVRVLLDAALTEEGERQRGFPPVGSERRPEI